MKLINSIRSESITDPLPSRNTIITKTDFSVGLAARKATMDQFKRLGKKDNQPNIITLETFKQIIKFLQSKESTVKDCDKEQAIEILSKRFLVDRAVIAKLFPLHFFSIK